MRVVVAVLLLAFSFTQAWAQSVTAPAPASSQVTNLTGFVVSGEQPGPGLWKVSKGDHVLWVLGTITPLPNGMQWRSRDVEDVIAQSQEVLMEPSVSLKPNTNFFGRMFLLPSLIGVRNDPDGKTLQQVVPPATYERWLVLKQKYIGPDKDLERYRPIFAALELYKKAIRKSGLTSSGGVPHAVLDLAKKYNVKQTPTEYQMLIDSPRAAIKTFKKSALDDIGCFTTTVDSIDTRLGAMTARGNAWAVGDLDALRKLSSGDQRETCVAAVTEAGFAQKLGLSDIPEHLEAVWLAAADAALTNNKQTFAMLPMEELLSPTGYLSKLKAQGYQVQSPDDPDE
jgi:hypothetical protein